MPKAPLLGDDAVEAGLRALRGWRREDASIAKEFEFDDFRSGLEFVNAVAKHADEQDHHPDVFIHWGTVRLTLWTHASGGITERDFRLAKAIDSMEDS